MNRSLSDYAARRLHFAIGSVISANSPYNASIDDLRAAASAAGQEFVSFANYDYIGIAEDDRIAAAAERAVREYGVGVGASRLVGGERRFHRELERALAAFLGHDDALALVGGYGTNVSFIAHILGANDLILVDALSHSSIMVGAAATRATVIPFEHNDLDHLEQLLRDHRPRHKRALVVCEGLYSMDGDCVDLPRVVALKDRFDAWLYVDEAHSFGVLGKTGRGVREHFGIDSRHIEFTMGTLSKTLGSCGGFIASNAKVIDWLRHTLPGYVYSVGIPPPVAAGAAAALAVLEAEPERVARLHHNARFFLDEARRRHLETGLAAGFAIVPLHFSTRQNALDAYRLLLSHGIYAPPIVQLAVPKDKPRLRMFISAAHTEPQMLRTLDLLGEFAAARGDTVAEAGLAPMTQFRVLEQGATAPVAMPFSTQRDGASPAAAGAAAAAF
ncbi:MAG: aminotransferase class I/II-fold pyridoxal phosphate-dependent enzyme [Rhizobiales bacterium]|nr:aminotransferase class I/II-fold pyridoxal phosphate-dependent enzyme [Hyphomicrobiales bacterium]